MPSQPNVREAIDQGNRKFMSAFEQGDFVTVGALYTVTGQVLPPGSGSITGRTGIGEFWAGARNSGIRRVELNTVEVDQQGDTAIEVGRGKTYGEGGDVSDEVNYLVVWKREGGEWRIHRDIWN